MCAEFTLNSLLGNDMNNDLREIVSSMRKVDSSERCGWLLKNYPITAENYYYVYSLIPHFSWKKGDRLILMNYYLQKIPYASEVPYKVFIQIAPVQEVVRVLCELAKNINDEDMKLLKYHLAPLIKRVLLIKNIDITENFLLDLRALRISS